MIRRAAAFLAASVAAVPAALWILRHERAILRKGRKLRPSETSFARQIGIRDPERLRVAVVPRIPAPLAGLLAPLEDKIGFSLSQAAGVTLGTGIYIAAPCESLHLVAHELVHVRQYDSLGGPLPFIHRYFYECLALGYTNAPLEVEARRLSRTLA